MFYKSKHRYVWIVGNFVFKIPRFPLISRRKAYLPELFEGKFRSSCWWFKRIVMAGLLENIREAVVYLKTRHPILARLYLPLIVINVYQRYDGVGNFRWRGEEMFYDVLCKDPAFIKSAEYCLHTFDHPENFAYDRQRVTVLDYGEEGFEKVIDEQAGRLEEILLSYAGK